VDTNCNPEGITFPIPGNDDAIRAISLFTSIIANAVVEADNEVGLRIIETLGDEDMEGLMGDASVKEEDDEVDIAAAIEKYADGQDGPASQEEAGEEEDGIRDDDKIYGE
jgi:small subunit ribosomal protein S2